MSKAQGLLIVEKVGQKATESTSKLVWVNHRSLEYELLEYCLC